MDSQNKSKKITKRLIEYDFKPMIFKLGVLSLIITVYVAYKVFIENKNIIISFSLFFLLIGLLYQGFRISENAKDFIFSIIASYSASLFLSFQSLFYSDLIFFLETWPYLFIIIYTIGIVSFNKERVTAQLTEGITLLLSLSIIYWSIDYGFVNIQSLFVKSILIIVLIISGFSIVNALTNIKLSKTTRLILSIWSTIVMFSFSIDNILRVFNNGDIEIDNLSQGISISLQYFLLGVSAVYIMQNLLLLISLLPQKGGNYKKDLTVSKKEHINRYSDKQVNIKLSLFCILYSVTIYILNFKFQILPRHTMIWFVFFTFPIITYFTKRLNEQTIAKISIKKN
ncbi:hypothetical protein MCETHM1_02293 [Flavobacteriaceae bacterium]